VCGGFFFFFFVVFFFFFLFFFRLFLGGFFFFGLVFFFFFFFFVLGIPLNCSPSPFSKGRQSEEPGWSFSLKAHFNGEQQSSPPRSRKRPLLPTVPRPPPALPPISPLTSAIRPLFSPLALRRVQISSFPPATRRCPDSRFPPPANYLSSPPVGGLSVSGLLFFFSREGRRLISLPLSFFPRRHQFLSSTPRSPLLCPPHSLDMTVIFLNQDDQAFPHFN